MSDLVGTNRTSKINSLYKNESGVAIMLALIMLLVMSILAITVSFSSNTDFQAMSNFKRGQESFLAAERCIGEGRNRFEVIGIEILFFLLQNKGTVNLSQGGVGNLLILDETLDNGAVCRSGFRDLNSSSGPAELIEIPPITKTIQRPLKNTSMPSSASGGAGLVPVTFVVTGKDSRDKDKDDTNDSINTGTEIAVGFETFIPGNANQMYSQ